MLILLVPILELVLLIRVYQANILSLYGYNSTRNIRGGSYVSCGSMSFNILRALFAYNIPYHLWFMLPEIGNEIALHVFGEHRIWKQEATGWVEFDFHNLPLRINAVVDDGEGYGFFVSHSKNFTLPSERSSASDSKSMLT